MSYYNPYTSSRFSIERRNEAIEWARNVLENKDQYLIVDTETSGLKETDVVVHFAAMDLNRNMVIDSFVRPTRKRRMNPEAEQIHGISMKRLKEAPIFEKVLEQFVPLAEGKKLLTFYAAFHFDMIQQTIEQDGIARLDVYYSSFECIQDKYKKFLDRDYLALPGRDNTGVGDCNASLDVIEEMAAGEIQPLPEETQYSKSDPPKEKTKSDSTTKLITFLVWAIGLSVMAAGQVEIGVALVAWGMYRVLKS